MTRAAERKTGANAVPPLGDVLDFMRLIWAMDHALARTSKHMDATIGLTGPQRLVLRITGRFPAVSAGRLAEILHLHPSTLTGVLQRLEQQGIIRRKADPRDHRRSLVELTAQGRTLDVETSGTVEAAVRAALRRFSPGALANARDVLRTITQALDLMAGGPVPSAPARGRGGRRPRRRPSASRSSSRRRRRQ